jgi:hypothetical protein
MIYCKAIALILINVNKQWINYPRKQNAEMSNNKSESIIAPPKILRTQQHRNYMIAKHPKKLCNFIDSECMALM